MKKGKTSKIQGFNTAKVMYGTVDFVNLKSLYLNIQTWVEPVTECENWNRVVLNLSRTIKHSILNSLNSNLFDNKFIVDLDLRSSGLITGKKSFMNLEVNFYMIQDNVDFKSPQIKESLKKITSQIFLENFSGNHYFDFYLTKQVKSINETIETINV